MKKLMILAAVAGATLFANAASLKWSANNVYQVGSTTTKAGATYLALAFISSDSTGTAPITSMADAIAKIKAGTMKTTDAVANKALAGGLFTTGAYGQTAWNADTESGIPGATIKSYVIIVDSKTVDDSGYLTGINNYMVLDETEYTFGGSETYTIPYGSQAESKWNAVPEPTSGLLLLLGVAGLALKRKRA